MSDGRATPHLFMLLWDDYGWPNQIGGLAILGGTSLLDRDGRIRIEAVRRHIEPKLALVPRFQQLLYRPRPRLGWPLGARNAGRGQRPRVEQHVIPLVVPPAATQADWSALAGQAHLDVSCNDSTRQHAVDGSWLSCTSLP
jgi:hypothetical protein